MIGKSCSGSDGSGMMVCGKGPAARQTLEAIKYFERFRVDQLLLFLPLAT